MNLINQIEDKHSLNIRDVSKKLMDLVLNSDSDLDCLEDLDDALIDIVSIISETYNKEHKVMLEKIEDLKLER
jgi:hypothetical protein